MFFYQLHGYICSATTNKINTSTQDLKACLETFLSGFGFTLSNFWIIYKQEGWDSIKAGESVGRSA